MIAQLLLGALLAADPGGTSPREPGWSLAGSGMLTLPDTSTLAPGRFTLGLALDNKDRDPLGLDLFDYSVAWTFGVTARLELYGHHVLSRVVSMPELPALPPPPLDLLVPPGAPSPPRPYYAIYAPVPYVNRRGHRFEDFVPGDLVWGLKLRLREARGLLPGLALSAEAKAPLSELPADLQAGSGTGGLDVTTRLTAGWRRGRQDVLVTGGFTHVGRPALVDREIMVTAPGLPAAATDHPLRLADRLLLGLGTRRSLGPRAAALAEAAAELDVGSRTPIVDQAPPVDVLVGIQLHIGGARLTAGLRYRAHAPPSMQRRRAPIGGLIDLTDVSPQDLAAYLEALGLSSALEHLRPGAQHALVPTGGATLPPGARLVPPTYLIRSEHQVGFIIAWGWDF